MVENGDSGKAGKSGLGEKRGGYASGPKPASELAPPPPKETKDAPAPDRGGS